MQQVGASFTTYGCFHVAPFRQSWFFSRLARIFLAAALIVGAVIAERRFQVFADRADAIAPILGFGLERVSVAGHQATDDRDIFAALGLDAARSLARFDLDAARARVERLPWVASAVIRPVFPNGLDIRVVERRAFAVWIVDGQERLIDREGRALGPATPRAADGLPRLAGRDAAAKAAAILAILARHPRVARHVATIERVEGRRWTLHASSGGIVHLPAEREAAALARLSNFKDLDALLGSEGRVIDLRGSGRVIVRERAADSVGKASS